MWAAQSGVLGHVKIGAGAQIAGMAHVKNDVAPCARMGGTPAKPFVNGPERLPHSERKIDQLLKLSTMCGNL